MNVSCPECRTVYRIDPRKVPASGVRARCIRCPGEFEVRAEAPAETSRLEREDGIAGDLGAPVASVATHADPPPEAGPAASAPETDFDSASDRGVDESQAARDEPPDPASPASGDVLPPAPFGSSDPRARARRLARVLVSDIVVYHPERRERSLQNGTLRQEFREEIRKSWDEYVTQVGNEIARETSYFQEALNEILAGGARVF